MKKKLFLFVCALILVSQTAGACGKTTLHFEVVASDGGNGAVVAQVVWDDKAHANATRTVVDTIPWERTISIPNADAPSMFIHFAASNPKRSMICNLYIDGYLVKTSEGTSVNCSYKIPKSHKAS